MNGFWQQWEDEVLASLYPSGGTARCVKALPNRSERSIRSRVLLLKLRSAKEDKWTPVEVSLIERIYPTEGAEGVRTFMPNRTLASIKGKASRLKLAHTASVYSHPHSKVEKLWEIPQHDVCDTHRAWQATRLPVYATGFGAAVIASGVAG